MHRITPSRSTQYEHEHDDDDINMYVAITLLATGFLEAIFLEFLVVDTKTFYIKYYGLAVCAMGYGGYTAFKTAFKEVLYPK